MKTNPYLEELSPNVSTSDVHSSLDVVVPVDGHQTIIGTIVQTRSSLYFLLLLFTVFS
jgi:hypothetical protein